MSTRSCIALHDPETSILRAIYCHFDGYIDHVGRLLAENYAELHIVRNLIALGDISSLGSSIVSTEAYARDRGEKLEPALVFPDVETLLKVALDEIGVAYVYIVSDFEPKCGVITGTWKYTTRNQRMLFFTL